MSNRKARRASIQPPETTYEIETKPPVKIVQPKNDEQRNLIEVIEKNDIIIVTGVAGSGKTHIACGLAAEYLVKGHVDKVVLSRPQVAAEDAGFLPGTFEEKIAPFLMPLYNELGYFINIKKEINKGKISILPVAYCRGLTFLNSFVVVDEFENLNYSQLKMILTRFGEGSKLVLCGDITQSDLNRYESKDCIEVINKMTTLTYDPGNRVAIIYLEKSVRHPIVEKINKVLDRGIN